jgi:predicted transcriptional regulator
MAAKRTYSVRLDDDQLRELETRADRVGLSVGHVIRGAITDFLRQEQEKDYLNEVRADIITAINRLGRQVEKDRAEQQAVMAVLDYLRGWLAFTLPAPADKGVAQDLLAKRTQHFYGQLPAMFSNKSRAKATARVEQATTTSAPPATDADEQVFSHDEGEA